MTVDDKGSQERKLISKFSYLPFICEENSLATMAKMFPEYKKKSGFG